MIRQGLRFQPNEVRHDEHVDMFKIQHTRFFAQMSETWEIHTDDYGQSVLIYVEKSWLLNFCIQTIMHGCGAIFRR